jgi:hypothetical protein
MPERILSRVSCLIVVTTGLTEREVEIRLSRIEFFNRRGVSKRYNSTYSYKKAEANLNSGGLYVVLNDNNFFFVFVMFIPVAAHAHIYISHGVRLGR